MSNIEYDQLMLLSAHDRRAMFETMTAENKAAIVRTHAKNWLDRNDDRLTASQVEVFRKAIVLITPELYAKQPDDERERALSATTRCRVSADDAVEALSVSVCWEKAVK
jgi:hypothetical protein